MCFCGTRAGSRACFCDGANVACLPAARPGCFHCHLIELQRELACSGSGCTWGGCSLQGGAGGWFAPPGGVLLPHQGHGGRLLFCLCPEAASCLHLAPRGPGSTGEARTAGALSLGVFKRDSQRPYITCERLAGFPDFCTPAAPCLVIRVGLFFLCFKGSLKKIAFCLPGLGRIPTAPVTVGSTLEAGASGAMTKGGRGRVSSSEKR